MADSQAFLKAICFLLVFILHAASPSLSEESSGIFSVHENMSLLERNSSDDILVDIEKRMKLNRPKDDQQLRLSKTELSNLMKRIRTSEHLEELREMWMRWSEKLPRPSKLPWVDPDVYYNMSGLVWSKGYPIEEYDVTTEDGYILTLFRIPHGKNQKCGPGECRRPTVFLQHGLLSCSTNWVENLANQSLGFILADAGFDVWMGNSRGNTYSRKHAWLDPDKRQFWQFSWDMMAKYDLPAMINFALAKSGQSQLAYVGHSQGSLIAFTGFAINPELGRKVKSIIALGPIFEVANVKLFFRELVYTRLGPLLADILALFGHYEFMAHDWFYQVMTETICAWPETNFLCVETLWFFGGHSEGQLNKTRVQVYTSNSPAGTSIQNMEHFIQMVQTKKCRMYDYGFIGNLRRYNQTKPPEYFIEDLNVPVALFWGDCDNLADPKDVGALIPRIPKLIYSKEIPNFEHLDFLWAMNAKYILYDDIISIIKGRIPHQYAHSY